jgi:zinc protease
MTPPSTHTSRDTLRDPNLSTGVLPNGMHYYIRVNKTPAKRAELWLAVNAGSILEDDDQRGFAHFLEHMAFNGTRHFPHNSFVDFVESSGMQFGADLNAFTSFDETVYNLTLPTDAPDILANGLQVLEDWANGGITIDSNEVLAERGVVIGEWRSRMMDTAAENYTRHRQNVLYGETSLYNKRNPIGLKKLLMTAEPGPIRRFYRDWYRPDLMAVIVVGDFDKAAMEREIKARFGKIPKRDSARTRPPSVLPTREYPIVDVFRGKIYPSATILWKSPHQVQTTEAAFRERLVQQLVFDHLQHTFFRMHQQAGRPFVQANISPPFAWSTVGNVRAAGAMSSLQVIAWPDSLEHGLTAAVTEIERIAQHGIPSTMLEHEKSALLRQYQSAADGERADPSRQLAGLYAEHYLTGQGLLLSDLQEYHLAKQLLPAITSNTVAEAARFWRSHEQQIIQYNLPEFAHVRVPTRETILASLDSVTHVSLSPISDAPSNGGEAEPLIVTPPTPGTIVRERHYDVSGVTEWTLSNGAKVLYKPTNFNPDALYIHAHSFGGTSRLPDSLAFSPGRLVGMMMTTAAGLGDKDHEQVQEKMRDKILREFQVQINYTDEAINVGGSPKNLETLFQILYLQFTAPKLDTAAVAVWKRYGYETLTQSANDRIAGALSRGNRRLIPPTYTLVDLVDVKQAMAIYRHFFGDAGDFTFTIVGAASPEQIKPLVTRYLASLPSLHRPARETPADPHIAPLDETIRIVQRVQPVARTTTTLVFDGLMPSDPDAYLRERKRITTLQLIVNRRLREVLREKLGGTYGVGVVAHFYASPKEHYQLVIHFDAAPERADTLVSVMLANLDSIRSTGATPQELTTVATIEQRTLESARQTNAYWMSALQQSERLGVSIDHLTKPAPWHSTPEDIRNAAQRYMPLSAYVLVTYLPKDSTMDHPSISKDSITDAGRISATRILDRRIEQPITRIPIGNWFSPQWGTAPWRSDNDQRFCRTVVSFRICKDSER